jgi:hypothetical protein
MNTKLLLFIGFLSQSILAYSQIPYGMVKIDDDKYIDQMEITIGDWLQYVFYVENNAQNILLVKVDSELLPDASVIGLLKYKDVFDFSQGSGVLSTNQAWTKLKEIPVSNKILKRLDKDSIVSILKRPVTGLTFEQASAYCKYIQSLESRLLNTDYLCSIPSAELIEFILENETRLDTEFLDGKKPKKQKKVIVYGDDIQIAAFGYPDNFGIFELWANAEEMTSENGVKVVGRDSRAHFENYQGPEVKLGFRCACRIGIK